MAMPAGLASLLAVMPGASAGPAPVTWAQALAPAADERPKGPWCPSCCHEFRSKKGVPEPAGLFPQATCPYCLAVVAPTNVKPFHEVSKSQIEKFDDATESGCQRRWWFKYMDHRDEPKNEWAELGIYGHELAEDWLINGKLPMVNSLAKKSKETKMAIALLAGIPHTPNGKHPGLRVESEIHFAFEGVHYTGWQDYSAPYAYGWPGTETWQLSTGPDGPRPVGSTLPPTLSPPPIPGVGDHKFTGKLQYALTPDELANDKSALIYAWNEMRTDGPGRRPSAGEAQSVWLNWVWMLRGEKAAQPVRTFVTRDHVVNGMRKLNILGKEITRLKTQGGIISANDLPPNPRACFAYGKPCPHIEVCNLSAGERLGGTMSQGQPGFGGASALDGILAAAGIAMPGALAPVPPPPATAPMAQPVQAAPWAGAAQATQSPVGSETSAAPSANQNGGAPGAGSAIVPPMAKKTTHRPAPIAPQRPAATPLAAVQDGAAAPAGPPPAVASAAPPVQQAEQYFTIRWGNGVEQIVAGSQFGSLPPGWSMVGPAPAAAHAAPAPTGPTAPAPVQPATPTEPATPTRRAGGRPKGARNVPKTISVKATAGGVFISAPPGVQFAQESPTGHITPLPTGDTPHPGAVGPVGQVDLAGALASVPTRNDFALYINAIPARLPMGVEVISYVDLIDRVHPALCTDHKVQHYTDIDFGKGPGTLAHYLKCYLEENPLGTDTIVTVDTRSTEGMHVAATLERLAGSVVRGS